MSTTQVRIFAVVVFRHMGQRDERPVKLTSSYYLQDFSFFQRSSARELLLFAARECVQRSDKGDRQSVKHKEHMCHVMIKSDGLACCVVANEAYPQRVAFSLAAKALEDFNEAHSGKWKTATQDQQLQLTKLDSDVVEFQDPVKADKLSAIQRDLDDTRGILMTSIEQLLERGESLQTLASKSDDLSFQSKEFMKRSESLNKCCVIL